MTTGCCRIGDTAKSFPYTDWSAQAVFLFMCVSIPYGVLSKCFSTGVPRHRVGAIITVMLVLLACRFYACLCGTPDCPFTRAGIKQTGNLVVSVLVLLLLCCSDLRTNTHTGKRGVAGITVLFSPKFLTDQRPNDTLYPPCTLVGDTRPLG